MEIKTCSICGEEKYLNDYYSQKKQSKSKGDYIYYNPECKECTKKKSRKWIKSNYDKWLEMQHSYEQSEKGKANTSRKLTKYRESGKLIDWQRKNKDKVKQYRLHRESNKTHEISLSEWSACKSYFNNECAYCGLTEEEHRLTYNQQLHREHVEHNGANDLSNCIPSCRICNSQKWEFALDEWYNESNPNFTEERLDKIYAWVVNDHKHYIENKQIIQ